MKKIISSILIVITITFTLSSCLPLGNGNVNDSSTKRSGEYMMITVKGGDSDYTCQVEVGTKPKIELPVKNQYMCTGLYSEEKGGTKYFDEEGDSTMVWQSNFPTVFYAHFEKVVGQSYRTETDFEEDPRYISFYKVMKCTYTIPENFIKMMESNSSMKIKVTVCYEISGQTRSGNTVKTYISSTSNSDGSMVNDEYECSYSSFTRKTLIATCSAKQILNSGKMYFEISTRYGYEEARVKNVYMILEIIG